MRAKPCFGASRAIEGDRGRTFVVGAVDPVRRASRPSGATQAALGARNETSFHANAFAPIRSPHKPRLSDLRRRSFIDSSGLTFAAGSASFEAHLVAANCRDRWRRGRRQHKIRSSTGRR